jgi:hypothetical protein
MHARIVESCEPHSVGKLALRDVHRRLRLRTVLVRGSTAGQGLMGMAPNGPATADRLGHLTNASTVIWRN